MTKSLRFDDEAIEELDAAAAWYEARRPSLGMEFLAAVQEALDRIASSHAPLHWHAIFHRVSMAGFVRAFFGASRTQLFTQSWETRFECWRLRMAAGSLASGATVSDQRAGVAR